MADDAPTPQPGSFHEKNVQMLRALVLANTLACFVWLLGVQAEQLEKASVVKALFGIAGQGLSFGLLAVASLATIALRNFLPAEWKYRLVFTRFEHPLPGCRAFTVYAQGDDRINLSRVEGRYPPDDEERADRNGPAQQNTRWYRILRDLEPLHPHLGYNHRIFLLLTDSMAIVLILIAVTSPILLRADGSQQNWPLLAILLTELLAFWVSARNAGIGLVRDVLAVASAKQDKPGTEGSPERTKQSRSRRGPVH